MCLGVLGAFTVLLVAAGVVRRFFPLGRTARSEQTCFSRLTSRPIPRVRAGPQALQVFLL